jgi:hypothetical protein
MARETGRSQGFGRVSPETRPSPYSPLHFRGSLPGTAGTPTPHQVPPVKDRRRAYGRRAAVAIAVLAAVVAGISYVAVSRSPAGPSRTAVAPTLSAASLALDEEARRLARSAIAVARR